MFGWFSRGRNRKQLVTAPFPQAWEEFLARNVGLAARLPTPLQTRLRHATAILVAERRFEGVAGFTITEEVKVTIAANAALLLLGVEGYYFDRLPSIIVRPKEFTRKSRRPGWIEEDQDVLGLAAQHGPISLAWSNVLQNSRHPDRGENVVLHEFAHHLDGLDGEMGGSLATGDAGRDQRIRSTLAKEYRRLASAVERGESTLISPNGTENEAEFFAYSVECFYGRSLLLRQQHPELYQALVEYFKVSPADWIAPDAVTMPDTLARRRRPRHGPIPDNGSHPPLRSADEYFTRGLEFWQEGKLQAALQDFTAAVALHPDDVEILEHQAAVLQQLERFREAEAACRRALTLAPDDGDVRRTLGFVLLDQDRFTEALPLLDQAVREMGDADSFFARGIAKACLKEWSGAVADFTNVLRTDPGDQDAEAWLAQCRQHIEGLS